MKAKFISAFLMLTLASMACGFNVNLPQAATPGPLVTDSIKILVPETGGTNLKLSFGAGEMKLSPGAENGLVDGTAKYNYDQFKPVIQTEAGDVTVKMGDVSFDNFLAFNQLKNEWDFKLGKDPMALSIDAGAYDATFELGGLSLTNLTITDGAADATLSFAEPNPSEMTLLHYETGASNIKMEGLANANFNTMTFKSGAGDYTLDFSGDLKRDATVNIDTGLSNVILVIPDGVNAVVTVDSGVSNIDAGPGWSQNGKRYVNNGSGPTLTVLVDMGAGNLTLTK